jgi:hypothetical protein
VTIPRWRFAAGSAGGPGDHSPGPTVLAHEDDGRSVGHLVQVLGLESDGVQVGKSESDSPVGPGLWKDVIARDEVPDLASNETDPTGGGAMSIARATKIVAGILFVVAAVGISTPVLLVPIGLAVWVLGEAA